MNALADYLLELSFLILVIIIFLTIVAALVGMLFVLIREWSEEVRKRK